MVRMFGPKLPSGKFFVKGSKNAKSRMMLLKGNRVRSEQRDRDYGLRRI